MVGVAAPEYRRLPSARKLLDRARAGELRLYVPSVCLTEAGFTVKRKFHPRKEVEAVRQFLAWGKNGQLAERQAEELRLALDRFKQTVEAELKSLPATLDGLRRSPDVEVFALTERMLERAAALGASERKLDPFDQAILAAVLEKAEELRARGEHDICFCELDSDLQPWDKRGNAKSDLTRLYDEKRVWVYGDFELMWPPTPPDWHGAAPGL